MQFALMYKAHYRISTNSYIMCRGLRHLQSPGGKKLKLLKLCRLSNLAFAQANRKVKAT